MKWLFWWGEYILNFKNKALTDSWINFWPFSIKIFLFRAFSWRFQGYFFLKPLFQPENHSGRLANQENQFNTRSIDYITRWHWIILAFKFKSSKLNHYDIHSIWYNNYLIDLLISYKKLDFSLLPIQVASIFQIYNVQQST